ncbi:MAG: hypothetical protein JO108_13035 [Acidobacteriaceae bacterium]|nr:hypothetical protein [Acidobacteriaceae bacterium]
MCSSIDEIAANSRIRRFQEEVYAKNSDHYERVVRSTQRPHTLMIACADSRANVEAITIAKPAEVFLARNIGNMVPS